jgi:hypothetical protein
MDNGSPLNIQDCFINIPFRYKKRVVKPLILEEQLNNIKQNESLAVVLRLKRILELEVSELHQIGKANVYKKLQTRHIRDEHFSFELEREDMACTVEEGFYKNREMLVLKGLGSFEDEETFRKSYKTHYNDSIKKLQREIILKQKRILLARCNNIEISANENKKREVSDSMEIEKEAKPKGDSVSSSYYRKALAEGWVYF